MNWIRFIWILAVAGLFSGCATYHRHGLKEDELCEQVALFSNRLPALSPEVQAKVLALNPTNVTEREVREVLVGTPAPRIVNIHGGIFPVHIRMISFSEFLVGMGYPRSSIINPSDHTYTFSCYENSELIAGMIAWDYEKEGLRPIIVGHSQGGFQAVKILYKLDGRTAERLRVWSPLTWRPEDRYDFVDPLTGQSRPVVGLRLPFVTTVGAGGLTRFLPNQWSMCGRLRDIPDSTEEFTGFYKGPDLLGGDFLGYGSANESRAINKASVRCVRLPYFYKHGYIPNTKHLLASPEIKAWLQAYHPTDPPLSEAPHFDAETANILWAAEVWYNIKKHWVLELQRSIQARRTLAYGRS